MEEVLAVKKAFLNKFKSDLLAVPSLTSSHTTLSTTQIYSDMLKLQILQSSTHICIMQLFQACVEQAQKDQWQSKKIRLTVPLYSLLRSKF